MARVIPTWAYTEPGVYHLPFAERQVVPVAAVREWAARNGYRVGQRGHLPVAVIEAFNRAHRFVKFIDTNPRSRSNATPTEDT